jgi:hypothetical protein
MKIEINVPERLDEITLEQYQKFEKLNTEENKDTAFLLQKMVQIFCGLDLKDVANIKYKSVQEITMHLNKIFDTKHKLKPTFISNNIEYGFIPVLDEMTLGEYIDLDENLGNWETMHKAMAVLYRPITFKNKSKYIIEKYKGKENWNQMKTMPLDVVFGAMVFFWSLSNELLTITLNYLQSENLTTQQQEHLERSGVGINQYTTLVKEMLPSLIKLPV